jgi:hypothetical protein
MPRGPVRHIRGGRPRHPVPLENILRRYALTVVDISYYYEDKHGEMNGVDTRTG